MPEEQNRTWTDRYMLRMPDGMRDKIKGAAEANNRSMNQEIIARLEATFRMSQHFFASNDEMSEVGEVHKVLSERARLEKVEKEVEELKKQFSDKNESL